MTDKSTEELMKDNIEEILNEEMDLERSVKVPFVMKDKLLIEPGVWNNKQYEASEIQNAFANTEWSERHVLSLFHDHNDASVPDWVGHVVNPRLAGNGQLRGDLVIVDKNTAMKLAYGAKFGISAKLTGLDDAGTVKDFEFNNFSIVVEPAVRTAFINSKEKEKIVDNKIVLNTLVLNEAVTKEELAKWDRAFINNLPDTAFAIILPGGEKDESGKTTPRSLRKLPHHNANVKSSTENNSVDLPHLRNALARLEQTDMSSGQISKARSHLEAHAKALKVGEFANSQEEILVQNTEEVTMTTEELLKQILERLDSLEAKDKEELSEEPAEEDPKEEEEEEEVKEEEAPAEEEAEEEEEVPEEEKPEEAPKENSEEPVEESKDEEKEELKNKLEEANNKIQELSAKFGELDKRLKKTERVSVKAEEPVKEELKFDNPDDALMFKLQNMI